MHPTYKNSDVIYEKSNFPVQHLQKLSVKVTGGSSIEIFTTNNEVVYISSRVHVSNKLTRTKYSY